MYYPASDDELEEIFLKRLNKMVLTKEEELKFKTAFMLFVGREYHKLDWAMQLHYGCKRDNNTLMFESWVLIPVTTASTTTLLPLRWRLPERSDRK